MPRIDSILSKIFKNKNKDESILLFFPTKGNYIWGLAFYEGKLHKSGKIIHIYYFVDIGRHDTQNIVFMYNVTDPQ